MNLEQLAKDLQSDEGFREYPYDDANGKTLTRGYTIQGVPTIGYGFTFLSESEAAVVLNMRASSVAAQLQARIQWISTLSEARQRALVNMAYQMGINGLLNFVIAMKALKNQQFDVASDAFLASAWASQCPSRAKRITDLIRLG